MLIIRNKILPIGSFVCMNILGLLFVREEVVLDEVILNHEAIHTDQQREILLLSLAVATALSNIYATWWWMLLALVMPFALYVLAWLIELLLPPYGTAYKDSPFEREAYANQHNPNYLATRPLFAWWRYMLKNR
ncbi:MAG: hypothetical protein J6C45_03860 [Alistipes sp.]|nr:hypothetical protein [Alistipes sp.]